MNVTRRDIIWTYLAKFFSLGVNIILLPMIMSYLTDTELALWYVFASISQVVNLFDFGFNPAISRHLTYAWSGAKELQKQHVGEFEEGKRNEALVIKVYHTCKVIYFIISILALVIMLTVGSVYLYEVLDHEITKRILASWMVYAFSVFLNLFYGYWSSLLQGVGAIAERNKITVYAKCVQIIIAVLLLSRGYGLLGFVISYAASGISVRLAGKHYFLQYIRDIDVKGKIPLAEIRKTVSTIWFTAWKDGAIMLAQYFSTQANTLVCAYYIDLGSTSSYGVLTQIFSTVAAVASALYSSYQPMLGSAALQRNVRKQKEIVCKTGCAYEAIYALLTVAFFVVGIPLLKIIRPSMTLDIGLAFALALFYFLYQRHCLYCSMISAENDLFFYKSFLVTAFVTILCSVIVSKYLNFGIWGLVGTQILANLVYNNWKWPSYMRKKLHLKQKDIWLVGIKSILGKEGAT